MMKTTVITDNDFVLSDTSGFSLVEFLISSIILLILSFSVFNSMTEIEKAATRQADTQEVMDNTRIALEAVTRCIRQAGNDPFDIGITAISIVGPEEVRIRSDLTGSEGPGNPDKGDPDGDINDSGEDISIRYNSMKRRIEMVPGDGPAQIIADRIFGFSLDYFDAEGNPTENGAAVQKIRVGISGKGPRRSHEKVRFGVLRSGTVLIQKKNLSIGAFVPKI
jgi:type II secretory pathway pseudopilin PulG